MNKLSMKTMDVGLQTTGSVKSASQTQDVSGDFKKMLEGKNEDAASSQIKQDSKEVSENTKQDKVESSDDTKKNMVSKDDGKTGKTDKTETDTRQAEEMIAAQLRERFTYGFVQPAEAETDVEAVVEADVSGIAVEMNDTGLEEMFQPTAAKEQPAIQIQTQMPEIGKAEPVQMNRVMGQSETSVQNVADVKSETVPVTRTEDSSETKQQTQDFSSQLKNMSKSSQTEEKNQVQPENFAAEQAAAVSAGTARVIQTEDVRPENVTTVYVSQPEELPEKVTDELLAKIVEGVQEFEIHIEPANLGKIAVKVLYEGSQATISIICSEKRAMDVLGQNAKEIGNIINRNLGGETTIIVDKQETDYLNQTRDENEQAGQNAQKQKEENSKKQDGEDAEQFLQKLRLGLAG